MALVPLTLWFLFSLLLLPSLDFQVIRAWMAVPVSGFLSVLLVAVLTYHAYLGTTVVVEDYVHEEGPKLMLMLSLRFLHVLCGGASIFAILRIAFGG
jgi:succinate dehydrogenase / fumarate reductase membrane anchor subunit